MKILLFSKENILKPVGGPLGYLYNIKVHRDASKDEELCFLNDGYKNMSLKYIILKAFYIFLTNIFDNKETNTFIKKIKNTYFTSRISRTINLNKYNIVHFHDTLTMYSQKKNLKNYSGIVVLTSHSPKAMHKEIIEDCVTKDIYISNKKLFDSVEKMDEYAFKRADYVFFPCPGAEEPYFHSWYKYKDIRDEKKIRYVPTGILPVFCKRNKVEIRKELNIPLDAIVISFVGRHNTVKGYDVLKKIFFKLDNVYVVCCGNIGSIEPPISNRWIEVGWTTDPYSYVGASDIYILPNRETYFDIAMLQTLSIGKCSVISNTGGNVEFINTPGVKLYNSIDEALKFILEFSNLKVEEREKLEYLQRKEFESKYSIDVFYKRYKETMKEILEKENDL